MATYDASVADELKGAYFFYYMDIEEGTNKYYPYYELKEESRKGLDELRAEPDFYEHILRFGTDPSVESIPSDQGLSNAELQLQMLNRHFRAFFSTYPVVYHEMDIHPVRRIFLPKHLFEDIMAFIQQYQLTRGQDLIFEIIALAQINYLEVVALWGNPVFSAMIENTPGETNKIIELVERVQDPRGIKLPDGRGKPVSIMSVKFVLETGDPIEIEHLILNREFIDLFVDYHNRNHPEGWRHAMLEYHHKFTQYYSKEKYRMEYANVLYHFLVQEGLFKLPPNVPTPEDLIKIIFKIMGYSNILVGNPFAHEKDRRGNIRNWIKR